MSKLRVAVAGVPYFPEMPKLAFDSFESNPLSFNGKV